MGGNWPDWRGECTAIVACGPSAKAAGVEKLRNRIHVIAIKESIQLCPWADVLYGCDAAWWVHRKGFPDFKGLKLAHGMQALNQFSTLRRVTISDARGDALLFGKVGDIGGGGNSGFQALNLAAQWGATGILLVGFDMQLRAGCHWYGRNMWWGSSNPNESNIRRWVKSLNAAAPVLKARKVDVVNTCALSGVDAYPKMSIDQALARWGL